MKKLSLGFLGIFGVATLSLATVGVGTSTHAQGNFDAEWGTFGINAEQTSELATAGTGTSQEGGLINVFKRAINWILSILSLITLAILLWGGFQMVTAAGDDGKYKKGFTILKQAAIGLAFIGLAWFIVSIIFWLIGNTTSTAPTGA